MLIKCTLCWLALAVLASGRAAVDQHPQEQTRSFDVRELLTPIPNWAGRDPSKPAEAPKVEDAEARLRSAIQTWMAGFDGPLKVELKEAALVATGTEVQLEALSQLIAELKRQRSIQINVEARFLAIGDKSLQALPDAIRNKIALAAIASQPLSEQEVARLLEVVAPGAQGSEALTAPNLTLLNQQRAFVQVSTNQFYKADFRKDEQGEMKPVIEAVWTGIHMDVCATASADGQSASAQVAATLQRLLGFDEVAVEGTDLLKQVPRVERHEFDRMVTGVDTILVDAKWLAASPFNDQAQPPLMLVLVRLRPITPPAADAATRAPAGR